MDTTLESVRGLSTAEKRLRSRSRVFNTLAAVWRPVGARPPRVATSGSGLAGSATTGINRPLMARKPLRRIRRKGFRICCAANPRRQRHTPPPPGTGAVVARCHNALGAATPPGLRRRPPSRLRGPPAAAGAPSRPGTRHAPGLRAAHRFTVERSLDRANRNHRDEGRPPASLRRRQRRATIAPGFIRLRPSAPRPAHAAQRPHAPAREGLLEVQAHGRVRPAVERGRPLDVSPFEMATPITDQPEMVRVRAHEYLRLFAQQTTSPAVNRDWRQHQGFRLAPALRGISRWEPRH